MDVALQIKWSEGSEGGDYCVSFNDGPCFLAFFPERLKMVLTKAKPPANDLLNLFSLCQRARKSM